MTLKIYHQKCLQEERKLFYLTSVEQALDKKVVIKKNDIGKPYLACHSAFISITHKDKEAVIAVSDQAIGIDLERFNHKVNVLKIAKRFFCASEYNYLLSLTKDQCVEAFMHFWTSKEAITKLKGLGVPASLKAIEIDPYNGFNPINDQIKINFQTMNDHYLLAVAMFCKK